jgi:hypothetical protein
MSKNPTDACPWPFNACTCGGTVGDHIGVKTKHPAAVALGKLGGSATSAAKAAAARANGAKNTKGRPKGAKDKTPRKRKAPLQAQDAASSADGTAEQNKK